MIIMGRFTKHFSEMASSQRYRVNDPKLHKALFILENIVDNGGRKYIFQAVREKITNRIDYSFVSPYHVSGIIPDVGDWILKDIPSEMAGSWIKDIASGESSLLEEPCSIKGEIHPVFKEIEQVSLFPKTYFCLLKNAQIITENGVIVSSDNKIFNNFTFEFYNTIEEHKIFRAYLKKSQYNKGNFATIVSPASSNYFHWIFDCLPRLKLLNEVIEEIDYLFVPADFKKFHLDSLNLLGFDEDKLVKVDNNTHITCENLFVPSIGNTGIIPKWACKFLREAFLPANQKKPHRFIYISRKEAMYRRVINEEEVEDFLQKVGFEIIEMSKLSFLDQVKICSEARIVVGPHGAGLSNTVFCQSSKVLEIFAPSYVNTCYWMLSNQVGNQYFYIIGQEHPGHSSPVWRDFWIDISKLKEIVDYMLIGSV